MLFPTSPADTPALVALAAGTGVFKPHEIVALEEVLDDYHASNHAYGHRGLTLRGDDGDPIGFAYYTPTAMTDATWELWWIAVRKVGQNRGSGTELLRAVEDAIIVAGGRLLLIETSSTPAYDPTRKFYLKHGYAEVARVPDFYADGDDKVVFAKRPHSPSSAGA